MCVQQKLSKWLVSPSNYKKHVFFLEEVRYSIHVISLSSLCDSPLLKHQSFGRKQGEVPIYDSTKPCLISLELIEFACYSWVHGNPRRLARVIRRLSDFDLPHGKFVRVWRPHLRSITSD
jgi:hypothetical protein